MRVENWNPNAMDETFENVAVERLVQAAEVVKRKTAVRLASQIGRGKTSRISRPVYRSGKYAGELWTSREPGRLMKSIRVTRKKTKSGKTFSKKRNVRVYAGSYPPGIKDDEDAYYVAIFEFYHPFMRPALTEALPEVKQIIGAK